MIEGLRIRSFSAPLIVCGWCIDINNAYAVVDLVKSQNPQCHFQMPFRRSLLRASYNPLA